jgi:hypothetical protein
MMSLGIRTFRFEPWRLQLYWPKLTVRVGRQSEFFIDLGSDLRFVWDRRDGLYAGAGFELLGLGIGLDYYKKASQSDAAEEQK